MKNLTLVFIFLIYSVSFAQFVQPKIEFKSEGYDFGKIKEGQIVEYTFEFANVGGDTLGIANVSTSCGCTAALLTKQQLLPGEKGYLKVNFDSHGRLGPQTKSIFVFSNDPVNPQKTLVIRGEVVPQQAEEILPKGPRIEFSKLTHDFGKVAEGKIFELTFSFKNVGSDTLEIKDIQTSCGCTAAITSKRKLAKGESGELRIEMDTTSKMGFVTRAITVHTNDPTQPEVVLTLKAEIIKSN